MLVTVQSFLRQSLPQPESPNGTGTAYVHLQANSLKQCPDPDHCLVFPFSVLGVHNFQCFGQYTEIIWKI
jgi:hypothetical protein